MQDRPTKEELLASVVTLLRDDVLAVTEGRVRFHVRVAINLLEIVLRELAQEGAQVPVEYAQIAALLADDGTPAQAGHVEPERVRQADAALAEAVRAGRFDAGPARQVLLRALRTVVDHKLAIANPKFLSRVNKS